MHNIRFEITEQGELRILDYPDAVKVVDIPPDLGKTFAHCVLHQRDLAFARDCIQELIDTQASTSEITKRALWHSALVACFKCFGRSHARSKLDPAEIYDQGLQMEVFEYLKSLRNKHIAHDDNDLAQALSGAIVASAESGRKVEDAFCLATYGDTLSNESLNNLRLVIEAAAKWVDEKIESEAEAIVNELRSWDYDTILNLPQLVWTKPTAESIHATRTTPGR
ncbi:hypothetical protein ACFYY5_29160 [Nocardia elegans]|uniref:Uncharacterized protein n=1 Tax=Nocardia elegans TaxID=300029 RepID=A0ABW6TLB4_9NOCA